MACESENPQRCINASIGGYKRGANLHFVLPVSCAIAILGHRNKGLMSEEQGVSRESGLGLLADLARV